MKINRLRLQRLLSGSHMTHLSPMFSTRSPTPVTDMAVTLTDADDVLANQHRR